VNLSPDQVTAVVLAGGFGTRIQHLLGNLPKPMAPVNGKPFVEWVVHYLRGQGIRRVALSTGHLAETIEDHFASSRIKDMAVQCVKETEPLGTAGGFLNAARAAGPAPAWLVLNGDSIVLAPLDDMFRAGSNPEIQGALIAVPISDAARYGTILQDAGGMLAGFKEKQPGAGNINAGMYLFRAETLKPFPHQTRLSFETDVFPALIARQARLKVCVTPAPFLDIGTPESLPLADAFVRRHREWFE
jgi:D-glycero-alpha-D-manno-heptose 1-phosphate guanylyltransferase